MNNRKLLQKIILLFLLIVYPIVAKAFSPQDSLTESANVYVISCEPGEVIYEKFGHSAIRIIDPKNGIDLIFHWGLYSFDSPNFVGNFIKGNLLYEMGVCESEYFFKEYIKRDSYIYSTKINYTLDEKNSLWRNLWDNYKPENRKYCYNFIYDNCATRVYDNIINSVSEHYFTKDTNINGTTYRTIINEYLKNSPWYKLGINLIISSEADNPVSMIQTKTFPFNTKKILECTKIIRNDKEMSFAVQSENVNTSKKEPAKEKSDVWTILIPLLLIIIQILYFIFKKHYISYFTQILLIVSGVLGLIILYLSVFSIHPIVKYNYNIFWCSPLNIVLAIILFTKRNYRTKAYLSALMFGLALSTIFIYMFEIQIAIAPLFFWYLCVLCSLILTLQTYSFALKKSYKPRHKQRK